MLAGEERTAQAQPVNTSRALADPRAALKITRLEIIPVNSLRTIFVKLHTDAGIVGIGEARSRDASRPSWRRSRNWNPI